MGSNSKLDQALIDLMEAFVEIEEKMASKFGDEEDSFTNALVETLETSIEGALEETDMSTSGFATFLSCLSEALEQLDPGAFEEDEEEEDEEEGSYEVDDDDVDIDEDDSDYEDEDEEEDDE